VDNEPLNEPDDEAGRPSLVKPWDPASATMSIHYPMRELLLADERAEYDTLM
jgi:antirestriction protein ArdC